MTCKHHHRCSALKQSKGKRLETTVAFQRRRPSYRTAGFRLVEADSPFPPSPFSFAIISAAGVRAPTVLRFEESTNNLNIVFEKIEKKTIHENHEMTLFLGFRPIANIKCFLLLVGSCFRGSATRRAPGWKVANDPGASRRPALYQSLEWLRPRKCSLCG